MKRLVALLELVWAVAHLVVAYFFVTSTFVAKTAIKEGIPAQAVLLLGGLAMAFFAAILAWRCVEVLRGSPQAGASA